MFLLNKNTYRINMVVVDGEFSPLGRLASFVAKKAREGENVIVINADKIVIKKNKQEAIKIYLEKKSKGSNTKGPFFPINTKGIVLRAIRGMINNKRYLGRVAFKRIEVYEGVPDNIKEQAIKLYKEAPKVKYITVKELVKLLNHE